MMLLRPSRPDPSPSILLVDDHPGVLYSTSRILTSHKFKVTTAQNADEALNQVKNQVFDLVVCDINMPGRSGLEFLNDLKQYDPSIASVVLTANGTVGMAIQAMKSGALGFVTKPYNETELLESIQAALEQATLVRTSLEMEFYTPMLEGLCNALLKTMEADEFATESSYQLVGQYSQAIANQLGLPHDVVYQIYLAGLFHDIGKIGIPDKIVRKTEALSEQEQQEMTRHPELGAKIIEQAPGMVQAAEIIRYHHEYFNGTGYPNRLSGEKIPLGSRILAVANDYDDLLGNRGNREPLSHEAALATIVQGSGTLYDPTVVDAAVAVLKG